MENYLRSSDYFSQLKLERVKGNNLEIKWGEAKLNLTLKSGNLRSLDNILLAVKSLQLTCSGTGRD